MGFTYHAQIWATEHGMATHTLPCQIEGQTASLPSTSCNEEPPSMQKHIAKPSESSAERFKIKLGMLTKELSFVHDNARPHTAGQPDNLFDSFGFPSSTPRSLH